MIYLLPDDAMLSEACADGLLVLNLVTGRSTFLDGTGAHMWRALNASTGIDGAVELLHRKFQVNRATLQADVRQFCEHLLAEGLAAKVPYQLSTTASADIAPSGDKDTVNYAWLPDLLRAVPRDCDTGDIVLLDVSTMAVETVQEVFSQLDLQDRIDFQDRTLRIVEFDAETGTAETPDAHQMVCVLWIDTTDELTLTRALLAWINQISPGGYVIANGLEAHRINHAVAAVYGLDQNPGIVPVDWLTSWWQHSAQ